MRIKDIQVDGFGVWNGLQLDDLPPGVSVVYGPNEAGKTTLMQFVRTVLYGFSPLRRNRYLPPVHGGKPGGRLRVGNGSGEFILQRYAAPDDREDDRGHLSVVDSEGLPRDPSQLSLLLSGVDEATYSNVFACGLREIQELGSLDDTSAADHLYKLTTGLDRVSLVDVMRELGTSRERLLSTEDRPSEISSLMRERDRLSADIEQLSSTTRRWSELSAQRAELAEEAAELEGGLEKTDSSHRMFEAALGVQGTWNLRSDLDRQLAALRDVKQLPPRAVEKLEALQRRVSKLKRHMKRLAAKRLELRGEVEQLDVNKLVLGQANRIEAIGEQAPWITTLEGQMLKLKEEIRRLDTELEQQLGSGKGNKPDELSAENYAVLKKPAVQLREANEKHDEAKQESEAAQREFEHYAGKFASSARNRQADDLQTAVQTTGQRVALLRKRIAVEEKLDQLARRREELEFENEEMYGYQEMPLRTTAGLGLIFAVGVMLLLIGLVGGANNWVQSSGPYLLFGLMLAGGSAGTKLLLERHTEDHLTDNRRQLDQAIHELEEAQQDRDDLDRQLPVGGGSLDARMREAEAELRELERLSPLTNERMAAEQRSQLAERRLAAARDSLAAAQARWKEALKSVGLPETFPTQKVKYIVKNNDQALELRRRRDSRREELEQREREMFALTSRIQQLLTDIRLQPNSDKPQLLLRQLAQALASEKETLELRDGILKKARKLQRLRQSYAAKVRGACRKRNALLSLAGVMDLPAFRQVAAEGARAGELRRKRDELSLKIQNLLAGQFTEEQIAGVFAREGHDLQARWDQRMAHMQEVRTRLAGLHEKRGACTHEMQQLAADRRLAQAQMDLGCVERQLETAVRRWQVLAVIGRALESVRKSYETDRQPETLLEASRYLSQLTLDQYRRVWMPLDRRELLVEDGESRSLPLEVLSRGTREAVYISLRLALATAFARRGALLPLVFDDVLVNLDASRVRAAAAVLRDFSQIGPQILMFTCHEHIMRIFQDAGTQVRQLPARHGIMAEPVALVEIDPPPPETEKPKRRRGKVIELPQIEKPEPVLELPPPPPPPAIPEEETRRVRWTPDPNELLSQAAQEDAWFYPTNEFEVKRKRRERVVIEKPQPAPYQVVPQYSLPDAWPVVAAPMKPTIVTPPVQPPPAPKPEYEVISFRYLPDSWPIAPMPVAPPKPAIVEPKPAVVSAPQVITRIDPPAKPKIVRRRKPRFTWSSPEVYWDEEEEIVETVVIQGTNERGRDTKLVGAPPAMSASETNDTFSGEALRSLEEDMAG